MSTVAATVAMVKYGSDSHRLVMLVAAGLALAVLSSAVRRPDAALLGYVVLLPLSSPNVLVGVHVRVSDELLVASALVLLPSLAGADARRRKLRVAPFAVAIGAWAAVFVAKNAGSAAGGAIKYSAWALLVAEGLHLCRTLPGLTRRLAIAFVATSCVTSVFGILQYAFGRAPIVGAPYFPGIPNSFLLYYTNYAAFIAAGFVVALALLIRPDGGAARWRGGLIGVLVVNGFAVATATSRGGVVVIGAGVVVLLLAGGRLTERLRLVALVGASVAAVLLLTGAGTQAPIVRRLLNQSLTANDDAERHFFQTLGRHVAMSHPLGIGYGNFPRYQTTFVTSTLKALFHSHETFVQIGLDAGWLGLIGFVVVVVIAVRQPFRPGALATTVAGGAAAAGLVAQGLNDFLLYDSAMLGAFALMLVLALSDPSATAPLDSHTPATDATRPVGADTLSPT